MNKFTGNNDKSSGRDIKATIFTNVLRELLKNRKVTCIGKIRNPTMITPLQLSSARIFSASAKERSK